MVQKKFKKVNQNFGDSGTLHRGGEQWLGQGLPTCHWVYCSQAANKKVKKNSKLLVYEARKEKKVWGLLLTFSFNEFRL